jgi:glucose-1-phosphate cytidylyltransferase
MKVVLFCGGLGTRLRDYSDNLPKPLVPIGYRPILWHVMKYYAHFGHKDFILCLGYKADKIREYFLNYNEYATNDFVMSGGGKELRLLSSDIHDWNITFVDTGLSSNVGTRLKLAQRYVEGEEYFLANYTDGLTDLPLPEMIAMFLKSGKTACFVCAKPSQTFHIVRIDEKTKRVDRIEHVRDSGVVVNGGYFIFRKEIFNYIHPGEELVEQPLQRLIAKGELLGYKYDRFWAMDTFREQQELSDMISKGTAPWEVWKRNGPNGTTGQ